MPRAIVLLPDGNRHVQSIPADGDAIRKILGGYMEAVNVTQHAVAYVNEDGKNDDLPENENATNFCHSTGCISQQDTIVGPMVIFGRLDKDGVPSDEEQDVPASLIVLFQLQGELN